MTTKFKRNEHVIIKKYIGDEYNERGRVNAVYDGCRYWVTNMNMPYMGTVSDVFREDELQKIDDLELDNEELDTLLELGEIPTEDLSKEEIWQAGYDAGYNDAKNRVRSNY